MKVIDTDRDLFLWLFDQLDQFEPRIPVGQDIRAAIDDFYQTMKTSEFTKEAPAYFREIFTPQCWEDAPDDAPRYSLALLNFIGQLSEEIRRYGYHPVSRTLLVEIMLEEANLYKYGVSYAENGQWIRSKPAFTKKFGVEINVKVPRRGDILYNMWDFMDPLNTN